MDVNQRIAALEAEIASLKGKPRPAPDEGAKISQPRARLDDLPDEDQCRQLLKIVTARHSILRQEPSSPRWAEADRDRFFNGFRGALAWCDVAATRTDKLDHKYGVRYWKDECSAWCRAQQLEGPYSVGAFMAACIAGGIRSAALNNFPHDLSVAVGHYGRVVRGGWRRVLKDGPDEPVRQ